MNNVEVSWDRIIDAMNQLASDRRKKSIAEGRIVALTNEAGQEMYVHSPNVCANNTTPCVFHSPSEHGMRAWPMNIRETGLIERLCEHGAGHPDPDSAAFMGEGWDVHGCDGCCRG